MASTTVGASASPANQGSSGGSHAIKRGPTNNPTTASSGLCDGSRVPDGRQVPLKCHTRALKCGSWNVRTMLPAGQLNIVCEEMHRCKLQVIGVAETRWSCEGYFTHEENTIYYSGAEKQSQHGVAVIVSKEVSRSVMGYHAKNDRLISVRFKAKPVNITFIQVYAPTSNADDETIDGFYSDLQALIDDSPQSDMLIVAGDMNARRLISPQFHMNILWK